MRERSIAVCIALACLALGAGCATMGGGPSAEEIHRRLEAMKDRWDHEPIPIGVTRQPFYDDAILAGMSTGVVRRQGTPVKLNGGRPIIYQDKSFEDAVGQYGVGVYHSVLKLPGQPFKIWYHFGGDHGYLGYAESEDGLVWDKSAAGLLRFNNFVLSPVHGAGILYDTHDTRWRYRYKLAMGGSYSEWRKGLTFAHSRNGKDWTVYPQIQQLEECDADTGCDLMWDEELGCYRVCARMWGMGVRGYRQFARPHIGDSSFPILLNALFIPTPKSRPWEMIDERFYKAHIYGLAVQRRDDIYIAYVNLFDDFGNSFYLATSRNGLSWDFTWIERREKFIPQGPFGSFDDTGVFHSSSPMIDVGDEHWIYYGGYRGTHSDVTGTTARADMPKPTGETNHPWAPDTKRALGVASIRLDGLWFLENTADEEGSVTTKRFVAEGDRFEVNADATNGVIAVDVLDERGRPIAANSGDHAAKVTGDSCHHDVAWSAGADWSSLKGRQVALRFRMKGPVRLYAFQLLGPP